MKWFREVEPGYSVIRISKKKKKLVSERAKIDCREGAGIKGNMFSVFLSAVTAETSAISAIFDF